MTKAEEKFLMSKGYQDALKEGWADILARQKKINDDKAIDLSPSEYRVKTQP